MDPSTIASLLQKPSSASIDTLIQRYSSTTFSLPLAHSFIKLLTGYLRCSSAFSVLSEAIGSLFSFLNSSLHQVPTTDSLHVSYLRCCYNYLQKSSQSISPDLLLSFSSFLDQSFPSYYPALIAEEQSLKVSVALYLQLTTYMFNSHASISPSLVLQCFCLTSHLNPTDQMFLSFANVFTSIVGSCPDLCAYTSSRSCYSFLISYCKENSIISQLKKTKTPLSEVILLYVVEKLPDNFELRFKFFITLIKIKGNSDLFFSRCLQPLYDDAYKSYLDTIVFLQKLQLLSTAVEKLENNENFKITDFSCDLLTHPLKLTPVFIKNNLPQLLPLLDGFRKSLLLNIDLVYSGNSFSSSALTRLCSISEVLFCLYNCLSTCLQTISQTVSESISKSLEHSAVDALSLHVQFKIFHENINIRSIDKLSKLIHTTDSTNLFVGIWNAGSFFLKNSENSPSFAEIDGFSCSEYYALDLLLYSLQKFDVPIFLSLKGSNKGLDWIIDRYLIVLKFQTHFDEPNKLLSEFLNLSSLCFQSHFKFC
ncbi:hypothetical protein GEMRC1_007717 [Eukaryota sp. GEM-RC1]